MATHTAHVRAREKRDRDIETETKRQAESQARSRPAPTGERELERPRGRVPDLDRSVRRPRDEPLVGRVEGEAADPAEVARDDSVQLPRRVPLGAGPLAREPLHERGAGLVLGRGGGGRRGQGERQRSGGGARPCPARCWPWPPRWPAVEDEGARGGARGARGGGAPLGPPRGLCSSHVSDEAAQGARGEVLGPLRGRGLGGSGEPLDDGVLVAELRREGGNGGAGGEE